MSKMQNRPLENAPNNLRDIRMDKYLTQDELAALVDPALLPGKKPLTRQTISNIETGRTAPRIKTMRAIAAALGVPVEEIFSRKKQVLAA